MKYLVFKDEHGHVISVASKDNTGEDNSRVGVFIQVHDAATTETIEQDEFESHKQLLTDT